MYLTIKQARIELSAVNMSLRGKDGEFRVNYAGGIEASAYYTNDLWDAVKTGLAMRAERTKRDSEVTAMTTKPEYKSDDENYKELLAEARTMKVREIYVALQQRNAMHNWAVKAYETALDEKTKLRPPLK